MGLKEEAEKRGAIPAETEGWLSVDVSFFKFENVGDYLTGILENKGDMLVGDKKSKVGRYTLKTKEGKRFAFIGSFDLDEKLKLISLKREVWIQYEHDEPLEEGRNIKKFKVLVKPIIYQE